MIFNKNKNKNKKYSGGDKGSFMFTRLMDFFIGGITVVASYLSFSYISSNIMSNNDFLVLFLSSLICVLVFVVLFVPWFLLAKKQSKEASLKEWEVLEEQ